MITLFSGWVTNVLLLPQFSFYKKNKSFFYIIGYFCLLLELIGFWISTSSFRFSYSDLIGYYYNYRLMGSLPFDNFLKLHPFELGFDFLNYTIYHIFGFFNIQLNIRELTLVLLYINLLIIFFISLQLFNSIGSIYIVSIYLFYHYLNMFSYNLVRQGFALSFLLLAFLMFIKKNNLYLSLFWIFIGFMFHKSILFWGLIPFFSVYFLRKQSINTRKKIQFILISILSVLYITNLNKIFTPFIGITGFSKYVSDVFYTGSESLGIKPNDIHYLILTFIFYLILFSIDKFIKVDDNFYLFRDLFVYISLLFLMFGFISFAFRLLYASLYLFPFIFIYGVRRSKISYLILPLFAIYILIDGWGSSPFGFTFLH